MMKCIKELEDNIDNTAQLKICSQKEMFDKYASELTKEKLSREISTEEVDSSGDGISIEVENEKLNICYIGLTVKHYEEVPEEAYKIFMDFINWAVEEELILHGTLAPLFAMKLSSFDEDGNMINEDGTYRAGGGVSIELWGKPSGVEIDAIVRRTMILLYPVGKYSREELNEKIKNYRVKDGINYFTLEGEVAKGKLDYTK